MRHSHLIRFLVATRCGLQSTLADTQSVFERYTEIENSTAKRIQALQQLGLANDDWVATEKVHGANFGIYSTDFGRVTRYAKRSGIMSPTEHFFGYHILVPELERYARDARRLLSEQVMDGQVPHTVLLNGELFGGKYEHPLVTSERQSVMVGGRPRIITAVQSDPFPQYSPHLHFYAFDIKIKATHAPEDDYRTLTYDEASRIFEQIPGLLYAKAVLRGPLTTITAFDVEHFQTTIPALVGMGNYPLQGNWSEGLVVKHARRGEPGFDPKGLTMFKIKSTAFQEISTDRLQGPRVDALEGVRREAVRAVGVQLPALESVLRDDVLLTGARELLAHVCENRLNSVLSKIGTEPFESATMSPDDLATLVAKDALNDFLKEAPASVVTAPITCRRDMTRYVLLDARRLVAQQWKRIVAKALQDG